MIGHQQIIAARRQGFKPTVVFVLAGIEPIPPEVACEDPERALQHKLSPTIYVLPDELGRHLDLRFLAGVRVHLHAESLSDQVIGLAEKIVAAGAAYLIAASFSGTELVEFNQGDWNAWKC